MVLVMLDGDGGGGGGVRGCQTVMRKAGKERQRAERDGGEGRKESVTARGVMGPFNNCRHTHTPSLSLLRGGEAEGRKNSVW